jgi:hypothetical protein
MIQPSKMTSVAFFFALLTFCLIGALLAGGCNRPADPKQPPAADSTPAEQEPAIQQPERPTDESDITNDSEPTETPEDTQDATDAVDTEGPGDAESVPDAPTRVIGMPGEPLPYGWQRLDPVFDLPGVRTEHFFLYSQMSDATTFDIALRVEALYDYYAQRFEDEYFPIGFPKLAFLFNNSADYEAAGGHPTMPGLFMSGYGDDVGARFMMETSDANWGALSMVSCPLMYHELFHQFVAVEISQAGNVNRQWPTWMDEGHGSLFFNLIWTGDGWVEGAMTLSYLYSAVMESPNFLPLEDLLTIDGARWHQLVDEGRVWACYMQSMIVLHYLYYGDGGVHRDLIDAYTHAVSTNVNGEETAILARQIAALEDDFYTWFNANMILPEEMWDLGDDGQPTVTPNVRVTGAKFYETMTAMMTSHLARAHARGQRFESGQDFLDHAAAQTLDLPAFGEAQWLPDTLREEMLWWHERLSEGHGPMGVEINYPNAGFAELIVTQPAFGLELRGTFAVDVGAVRDVEVEYVSCPSINLIEAERIVQEMNAAPGALETIKE